MSDYKIGEASWEDDDVSINSNLSERKKIPFLKMEHQHDYRVRIISKPYRYYYKWAKRVDGKSVKLNDSLTDDSPLAEDGKEPSMGWYVKVLYREPSGKTIPAVIDIGVQIKKGIQKYQANPDFGEVKKYDITICKGRKGEMPLYTVQAAPPKAITDEEKAIAGSVNRKEINGEDNPDYIDLEERCKPLSAEVIRKILTGESGKDEASTNNVPDEIGVFLEDETIETKPEETKSEETKSEETKSEETKSEETKKSAPVEEVKQDDEDFLDF